MKKVISIILTITMLMISIHCIAEETINTETPDTYESFFEKDTILDINIDINEADLQDMYSYPRNEEYHSADITVNGVKVENAGIRTKGNMTLSSVAQSDSDRYSFRIKFDKYVKGQTLLGLDELCLNSGYSDPSYMREYLHYEILRKMGMKVADTAFCNVYINGELYGFYLAVEALDDTFLESNFGENYKKGNFYKMEEGASLIYKDDENYSYADLKSGSDKDLSSFKEFVKNLNDIPDGEKGNIESFLDVDSALIYIASNTVLCNYDSYGGNQHHNFYLYEDENGIFTVVPWDFNMSFGGFRGNSENVGIDTPFISGSLETLPLIGKLLSVEEYKNKYYDYIKQIMDLLENFEERTAELKTIISPYVEKDVSAFYTYEEFNNATTKQDKTDKIPQNDIAAQNNEMNGHGADRISGEGKPAGGGKMFGSDSSIINCVLDRLENLNAQFAGTAEKSTSSGNGRVTDFNGEKRPPMPEGFDMDNMKEFMENDNNHHGMGFDGNFEDGMHGNRFNPDGKAGNGMWGNKFGKEKNISVIRVHVDGHIVEFNTEPVIENDTTLVGFRAILEALGAEVEWDGETQTVTAVKGDTTIVLTIDSDIAYVNGKESVLLAAPKILDGSTMVPVRFISEQLKMKVDWDEETKLITVTSK